MNDINILPGAARDIDNVVDLVLASTLTKRLDANWTLGHNGGGLDTGAKANSAWYHVWLIRRASDGANDALLSGSATAPAMPSGWAAKRRLGAIVTDDTGTIRQFRQAGDYFGFVTPATAL